MRAKNLKMGTRLSIRERSTKQHLGPALFAKHLPKSAGRTELLKDAFRESLWGYFRHTETLSLATAAEAELESCRSRNAVAK